MATQASPGLNAPSAYQALPGFAQQVGMFPPGANNQGGGSTKAAVSAAQLPANVMLATQSGVGLQPIGGNQTPSLLSEMAESQSNGTGAFGTSPNIGTPSTGPAGNVMNGGNPGATSELTIDTPANSLTLATTGGNNNFCG
jgi:hypothetical protein